MAVPATPHAHRHQYGAATQLAGKECQAGYESSIPGIVDASILWPSKSYTKQP